MQPPRFRLRTLMIAVAVAAGFIGFEMLLYRVAAAWALEHPSDTMVWDEALTVWIALHVLVSPALGFVILLWYAAKWLRSLGR